MKYELHYIMYIINIESNYGTLDSRRGNGIMETDLNQIGGKESRISERPDDETEINEAQRYNPNCIRYTHVYNLYRMSYTF